MLIVVPVVAGREGEYNQSERTQACRRAT
jgi:hypothetical protein